MRCCCWRAAAAGSGVVYCRELMDDTRAVRLSGIRLHVDFAVSWAEKSWATYPPVESADLVRVRLGLGT